MALGCGGGAQDDDRDRDGWRSIAAGGEDCDDRDPAVHPGAQEAAGWTLDTVVHGGSMVPKVTAGPDAVFVAFYDQDLNQNPWLATRGGASWELESLDLDDVSGLDVTWTDGGVDVLIVRAASEVRLLDARLEGSTWSIDPVPGATGDLYDMVAASSGQSLGVAYRTADGTLMFAWREPGGWLSEPVVSAGETTFPLWVAMDSAGAAHISSRAVDGVLQYSTNRSGLWRTERLEAQECCARVAVDPTGEPWLAFADEQGVAVLRGGPGAWTTERVAELELANWQVTLAFDPDGGAHVLYIDDSEATPTLLVAHRIESRWIQETVATLELDSGLMPSLHAGARGRIDVAYYDQAGQRLVHAFRTALADGRDQDCDGTDTGDTQGPTDPATPPDYGDCGPCALGQACCASPDGPPSCTLVLWDATNCGGCGASCPANESCYDGLCVCGGDGNPYARCDGACIRTDRSEDHCGACGNDCPVGDVCVGSTCLHGDGDSCPQCAPDSLCCAGAAACVDPLWDAANCGGCGQACAEGESCEEGRCVLRIAGG